MKFRSLKTGQIDFSDSTFHFFGFPSIPLHIIEGALVFYAQETAQGYFRIIGNPASVREALERRGVDDEIHAATFGRKENIRIWRMLHAFLEAQEKPGLNLHSEIIQKLVLAPETFQQLRDEFPKLYPNAQINRMLKWYAEKKETLDVFLDTQKLGMKEAKLLYLNFRNDLEWLSIGLEGMALGGNRCVALLEMLSDLKRRNKDRLKEHMTRLREETRGDAQPRPENNERYKMAQQYLTNALYPRLKQMRQNRIQKIEGLSLPPNIRCSFDSQGEKEDIEFSVVCRNMKDWEKSLGILNDLTQSEEIQKVFFDS